MKKVTLIALSLIFGFAAAFSQDNVWSGNLVVQGVKLPLVFHLDAEKPTMDSPAQGAKGIPIQLNKTVSDSISINIPMAGATFNGVKDGNDIKGVFTQRGMSFPLTLVQGKKETSRPQTPKPPFPYSQEDVSFTNGNAVLKGTLTMPTNYTKETPVVIMVTGSGLQNRDEEIFEHKPFAVIADALARNGIASLRYDDRGFGESTGDVANCTTEDLMNDALSGIDLLRERFSKVGVLGHSEGGTIAFMIAADKKADFIISLAGMTISGKELLMDQNRYLMAQAGFSNQIIDTYCELLDLAFSCDKSLLSKLESSEMPTELKQNIRSGLKQLESPYMQYFLSLNVSDRLDNVSCPVLALNGKKDTQVFYEKNFAALNKGLPANNLNQIIALDDLNHLFQHCKTGSSMEYGTIEETISPEVLNIICSWTKSLQIK